MKFLKLALISCSFLATSAFSGVQICNKSSSEEVYFAWGHSAKDSKKIISIGWYKVAKDKCQEIYTNSINTLEKTHYLFGVAKDGKRAWAGEKGLCVHLTEGFRFTDAEGDCKEKEGSKKLKFITFTHNVEGDNLEMYFHDGKKEEEKEEKAEISAADNNTVVIFGE